MPTPNPDAILATYHGPQTSAPFSYATVGREPRDDLGKPTSPYADCTGCGCSTDIEEMIDGEYCSVCAPIYCERFPFAQDDRPLPTHVPMATALDEEPE